MPACARGWGRAHAHLCPGFSGTGGWDEAETGGRGQGLEEGHSLEAGVLGPRQTPCQLLAWWGGTTVKADSIRCRHRGVLKHAGPGLVSLWFLDTPEEFQAGGETGQDTDRQARVITKRAGAVGPSREGGVCRGPWPREDVDLQLRELGKGRWKGMGPGEQQGHRPRPLQCQWWGPVLGTGLRREPHLAVRKEDSGKQGPRRVAGPGKGGV